MQAPTILRYAVSTSRTGRVLVLMSRNGVVDVVLVSDRTTPRDWTELLAARFPDTRFILDDGERGSWAAAVVARLDGAQDNLVVPIDLAWRSLPAAAHFSSAGAVR
ncbi:MAG: hypothetical protein P4L93_09950 [Coriobacteriia bacterium]|nr:hypothetical protein [Coriobacteriia bacterium]